MNPPHMQVGLVGGSLGGVQVCGWEGGWGGVGLFEPATHTNKQPFTESDEVPGLPN